MDRYIATQDLQTLATEYEVTTEQVLQFIQNERSSGNIDAVYAYVNANPGATLSEVATDAVQGGLDQTTAEHILRLLEFAGWIVKF